MLENNAVKLKSVDLQIIISKLLNNRKIPNKDFALTQDEAMALCYQAKNIFMNQPMLLELNPPIHICGDIHGQFVDLKEIFKSVGTPTQGKSYLFLGDYVDRGKQSLQCICLLFAYKIQYPQKMFMLRGNHQSSQLNKIYGFYDQCKRRLNLKVWKTFCDTFKCLPAAAIVGDRIFCVHGGLSPCLNRLSNINQVIRPIQCQRNTMLSDLLWSDPSNLKGWSQNLERGISYYFGQDIVKQFLQQNDFDLICRSHQVVEDGYQFFANRKLITIFSSPNYCSMYDNFGAILTINSDMNCHIKQFQKQCLIKLRASRQRTPEVSRLQKMGGTAMENIRLRNSSLISRNLNITGFTSSFSKEL